MDSNESCIAIRIRKSICDSVFLIVKLLLTTKHLFMANKAIYKLLSIYRNRKVYLLPLSYNNRFVVNVNMVEISHMLVVIFFVNVNARAIVASKTVFHLYFGQTNFFGG